MIWTIGSTKSFLLLIHWIRSFFLALVLLTYFLVIFLFILLTNVTITILKIVFNITNRFRMIALQWVLYITPWILLNGCIYMAPQWQKGYGTICISYTLFLNRGQASTSICGTRKCLWLLTLNTCLNCVNALLNAEKKWMTEHSLILYSCHFFSLWMESFTEYPLSQGDIANLEQCHYWVEHWVWLNGSGSSSWGLQQKGC